MYPITLDTTKSQLQVNTFVRSVYNWMAIGLAITGLMAYYVAHRRHDLCQLCHKNRTRCQ